MVVTLSLGTRSTTACSVTAGEVACHLLLLLTRNAHADSHTHLADEAGPLAAQHPLRAVHNSTEGPQLIERLQRFWGAPLRIRGASLLPDWVIGVVGPRLRLRTGACPCADSQEHRPVMRHCTDQQTQTQTQFGQSSPAVLNGIAGSQLRFPWSVTASNTNWVLLRIDGTNTHPAVRMTGCPLLCALLRRCACNRWRSAALHCVSNMLCGFTGGMLYCMPHASGGGHAMRQA